MMQANKIYGAASGLAFILAVSFFITGCAPLLVGAGAVGGYKYAEHTNATDHD